MTNRKISALKAKKEIEKDLTKERDERSSRIARVVLKKIGDYEGSVFGDISPEETAKAYDGLGRELLELYLKENVIVADVNYIHRLVLQAVQATQDKVTNSVNQNMRTAENKIWKKDPLEITFCDLKSIIGE